MSDPSSKASSASPSASSASPPSSSSSLWRPRLLGGVLLGAATVYMGLGYARRRAAQRKVGEAKELCSRGIALNRGGDVEAAIDAMNAAIELNGEEPVFFVNRALIRMKTRQYDEAARDATRAIELGAAAKAYYVRGRARLARDDIAGAVLDLQEAQMTNRDEKLGFYIKQKLHAAIRRSEAASRASRQAAAEAEQERGRDQERRRGAPAAAAAAATDDDDDEDAEEAKLQEELIGSLLRDSSHGGAWSPDQTMMGASLNDSVVLPADSVDASWDRIRVTSDDFPETQEDAESNNSSNSSDSRVGEEDEEGAVVDEGVADAEPAADAPAPEGPKPVEEPEPKAEAEEAETAAAAAAEDKPASAPSSPLVESR